MTTVRPPKVENVPLQNPIWNALQQFTIGDVLVPRSVTFIEPWMPIEDVLALMSSKGYMSLPVLNSNGGIAGVVDVIDVVAFYASVFAKVRAQQPPEQKKYENKNGQDIPPADELVLRRPKTVDPKFKPPKLPAIFEDDWMNNPIGSLVNYSRRHSPLYVHRSMLLSDLVQTLTNGKHHRVMVLVDDPISPVPHPFEIVAVISCLEKSIVAVEADVAVIDALKYFMSANVSVLAVVDKMGLLINSFSGTDLRRLTHMDHSALVLTVGEFIDRKNYPDKPDPLRIKKECMLLDAIDMIADSQKTRPMHHLWMCDVTSRAGGLVSLTDFMRIFSTYHLPVHPQSFDVPDLGSLSVTAMLVRHVAATKSRHRTQRCLFVGVRFPGQSMMRTPAAPDNENPSFRTSSFTFKIDASHLGRNLTLYLYDKRKFFFGPDKLIGQAEVDIAWIANGFGKGVAAQLIQEVKRWIPLHHPNNSAGGSVGEILVRLVYARRNHIAGEDI